MLFFVIALGFYFRLSKYSDPTGADGYFYLKQIQSLSELTGFYYKDYSFGFFLPALINVFIKNPLQSFLLSSCLLFGANAWLINRIASRLIPDRTPVINLIHLLLITLCFCYCSFFIELNFVFLKTATATFFFLLTSDFLLRTESRTPAYFAEPIYLAKLTFVALLSLASHKIMFAFIPLLFLSCGWSDIQSRLLQKRRVMFLCLPIVLLIFIFLTWTLYPKLAQQFIHIISFSELTMPTLHFDLFDEQKIAGVHALVFLIGAILSIILSRSLDKKNRWFTHFSSLMLLFPFLTSVFTNSDGSSNSITFRTMIVVTPLLFVVASVGLLSFNWRQRNILRVSTIALSGFIFFLILGVGFSFNRPIASWLNPWAQRMANLDSLVSNVPNDALIYAPHGVEFFVAYRTPFRPRSLRLAQSDKSVYRIAYVKPYLSHSLQSMDSRAAAVWDDMNQLAIAKLGKDFYVFKEVDWISLNQIHLFRPHPMNLLDLKPTFVASYE